jgi:hypothetical protein
MSAPAYVPTAPDDIVRSYSSSPRRPQPWIPARPGELGGEGFPVGERFGNPGPDQGYIYRLVPAFESRVHLAEGESWDDVKVGAVAVALKRAGSYGRAPVSPDLTVGFGVWGFLEPDPPADLVEFRRQRFAAIAIPAHYAARRAVADTVPEATLRRPPAQILAEVRTGWRNLLDTELEVSTSH